jgi:hypothetical protein
MNELFKLDPQRVKLILKLGGAQKRQPLGIRGFLRIFLDIDKANEESLLLDARNRMHLESEKWERPSRPRVRSFITTRAFSCPARWIADRNLACKALGIIDSKSMVTRAGLAFR